MKDKELKFHIVMAVCKILCRSIYQIQDNF